MCWISGFLWFPSWHGLTPSCTCLGLRLTDVIWSLLVRDSLKTPSPWLITSCTKPPDPDPHSFSAFALIFSQTRPIRSLAPSLSFNIFSFSPPKHVISPHQLSIMLKDQSHSLRSTALSRPISETIWALSQIAVTSLTDCDHSKGKAAPVWISFHLSFLHCAPWS